MRRTLLSCAATAAAALTGAFLAAEPAAAAPASRLTVTVRPAEGPAKSAWLTCGPTGGSHRSAARACADLSAARGDVRRVPAADVLCTMEYAPVTATLTGRWQGRAVRFRKTFDNSCTMARQTGAVFRL